MTTSLKNNLLSPSLISNLQRALISRTENSGEDDGSSAVASLSSLPPPPPMNFEKNVEPGFGKPVILVTNGEGRESPGLTFLVETLVADGSFNVHVCAPQLDRSMSGHSLTTKETISASSVDIGGATGFEVSGTPADCVSLALSGALFSWTNPLLVISGINRGSSCAQDMFYSGAVAAAREALFCGVPSLCISLNWKEGVSSENDLKDAATVCLPLLIAAVRDIEKGTFPKNCLLNIEIPTRPLARKGFKVTRQSSGRCSLNWQAVSANRNPSAGHFLSNQQSLGIKLAQLSRDASAAGAARRLKSERKNVEIESVGVSGRVNPQQTVKKYFRLEFSEKKQDNEEKDLNFEALEDGFIAITPVTFQSEIHASVSSWIAMALDLP